MFGSGYENCPEFGLDNGVVSINFSRTFFTGIGHVLEYVDQVLKIHSFQSLRASNITEEARKT